MDVTLIVVNEKANTRQVRLAGRTVIGRSPECQLRIASGQVSRKHCEISIKGTRVLVRDLGSANGTEVDGQTIPPDVDIPVAPGSTLVVGPLKFVFEFTPSSGEMRAVTGRPMSTTDLPGLLVRGAPEEETKDYTPSNRHADEPEEPDEGGSRPGHSSELDFAEGEPTSPAAMLGQQASVLDHPASAAPEDTVHDQSLADHAREAALRARRGDNPMESGTDLLSDEDLARMSAEEARRHAATLPTSEPGASPSPQEEEPASADEAKAKEEAAAKKGWNLLGFLRRGPKEAPSEKPVDIPPNPAPRNDDEALQDFFKNFEP